jgi:hypothetical protein
MQLNITQFIITAPTNLKKSEKLDFCLQSQILKTCQI